MSKRRLRNFKIYKDSAIGLFFTLFLSLLVFGLSACGETSSSGLSNRAATATGLFLDLHVDGLQYQSGSLSGITDANGKYVYEVGRTINFRIGDISLGSGLAGAVMTPVDLAPGAAQEIAPEKNRIVTNIVRFLMTIDDDADATNGIQINFDQRDFAKGETVNFDQETFEFETDGNVLVVIGELTARALAGPRALVTATEAQVHMKTTLARINTPFAGGTYVDSTLDYQLLSCLDPNIIGLTFRGVTLIIDQSDLQNFNTFTATIVAKDLLEGVSAQTDITLTGTISTSGQLTGSYTQSFVGASGPKNNPFAVVLPTVNDDSTQGYEVDSIWLWNTQEPNNNIPPQMVPVVKPYKLEDSTPGAAVWTEVPNASVAGLEDSSGAGTFTGQVNAGVVTLHLVGADTGGDTCTHIADTTLTNPLYKPYDLPTAILH